MAIRYLVLAIAGGLLSAAQLGAQGTMGAITGRVVDTEDKAISRSPR